MLIQAEAFRAIFRAMIQYFTFRRFDCFAHLQEKHFTKKEGVINTPNHYKMNDTHYKQFIAGKIPI